MRRMWLAIVALTLLTVAAYWRVFLCDFVNYDDNDYVTGNAIVQKGLTAEGVGWAFGRLHGDKTYWHPLTWMSHMLDCQVFGLNPMGHHAMNLFIHVLNVALLFVVLQRMTGAFWRSAMLAALWSVHPLQVDTVAWVTERKNLLAAFFWILSMFAYARYAERPGWGRYAAVFVAMALGLLCKPVLITLPCVLLLLDFWPLRRVRWDGGAGAAATVPAVTFTRAVLEKLPLIALSIVSAVITVQSHDALGVRDDVTGLTFGMKVANAIVSYTRYLDHVFWPAGLNVLYLHPGAWPTWRVATSVALLLVLTTLALVNLRLRPFILIGWLWFLGVLVPTIGLHQAGVQAMADRFAYIPLIGVFIVLVWTVTDWVQGLKRKNLVSGVLATVSLLMLSAATTMQTGAWRNSFTLWSQAIAVDPANYIAHNNIAAAWLAAGQLERARHHASESDRTRPRQVRYPFPQLQLAFIGAHQGKVEEARTHAANALAVEPGLSAVIRAVSLNEFGRGNAGGAAGLLAAYVRVVPGDLEARTKFAMCLEVVRPSDAVLEHQAILQINPDTAMLLNNFAWARATHPDASVRNGSEAVRLAERACQLTNRKEPVYLGTLAAAYAEVGRFEDAIKAGESARDLAKSAGQAKVAEANEQLLAYYRARKPYRREPLN